MRPWIRPLVIAISFTIVAVVLAVAPVFYGRATYEPTLAVLTATLIAVIWYSLFTHQLAESAERQLRVAEEQLRVGEESLRFSREIVLARERRTRRALQSYVRTLSDYLGPLPPGHHAKILREINQLAPAPSEQQLEKLTDLAADLGAIEDEIAGRARTHLTLLAKVVSDTQRHKYDSGEGFPKDEWTRALDSARDELEKLSEVLSKEAGAQEEVAPKPSSPLK